MLPAVTGTITPWLLGGLSLIVLLTLSITVKSWREAKRSPYFFMRRQAMQRMQSYLLASFALIAVTLVTAAYAWQAPPDTTPRYALITNAKPVLAVFQEEEPAVTVDDTPPVVIEIGMSPVANRVATPLTEAPTEADSPVQRPPTLPDEFNKVEPTAELTDQTNLGTLAFSTSINNKYEANDPGRQFSEGNFTLYATFRYQAMANGMAWAWVWRHNGRVVGGGNEKWAYGKQGPGYIYFGPEEGFQSGEYTLEVWVNNELMTQANLVITEGISAGN